MDAHEESDEEIERLTGHEPVVVTEVVTQGD